MARDGIAPITNRDPGDERRGLCNVCGIDLWGTWIDECGYLVARCLFGHSYRVRLLPVDEQRFPR